VDRKRLGTAALNRQTFIVGYQQFVGRKHLHAALCSAGHEGSGGKENGAAAVHEWHRSIAKERFRRAIQKLPRRWQ
jgi:hypothetical protein